MAATACPGAAGVDGEVQRTAEDRRRPRTRATGRFRSGKRGAGEGKRERGQVSDGGQLINPRGASTWCGQGQQDGMAAGHCGHSEVGERKAREKVPETFEVIANKPSSRFSPFK